MKPISSKKKNPPHPTVSASLSLLGVDDVFVFISTFRQAAHVVGAEQRMLHTVKTASRATFLTSFTTAAAYAANAFSQVLIQQPFSFLFAEM